MKRAYVRQWLDDELGPLFVKDDHSAVVNWMLSHRGVPKVVLIGSGFTRNAEVRIGLAETIEDITPLWPQVTEALRRGLGYPDLSSGPSDALQLAEQYQESVGISEFRALLLGMLRDDDLVLGDAHKALQKFPAEAIITTNQLDTLLDRLGEPWHPVIDCADLPLARMQACLAKSTGSGQVIYLHGHRSAPSTWVFSRSEYEDIQTTRPAIVTRVQQLLSEYPLLVLGYSLSDPDFHALFRLVNSRLRDGKPRALCITVGASPPLRAEKVHWQNLGMYLAHMQPGPQTSSTSRYSGQLAKVLRLDESLPPSSYVIASLSQINRASDSATLSERLRELRTIFDELESLETSDFELSELYHSAWKGCLRGVDGDAGFIAKAHALRDEAWDARARGTQSANGSANRRTEQPSDHLAHNVRLTDLFVEYIHTDAYWIVLAVDAIVSRDGSQPDVCASVGEWLAFALRKRILGSRPGTLAGSADEAIVVDLLKWVVSRLEGDSRCGALDEVLDGVAAEQGVEILSLLSPNANRDCDLENDPTSRMIAAWVAVWRNDIECAIREYDLAARCFRTRGDFVGEWIAQNGLFHAAERMKAGVGFTIPSDAECARAEKCSRESQKLGRELETRRAVRRFLSRKRRIIGEAQVLAERRASERAAEPGERRTRFSATPVELRKLLCELGARRCHPEELRQPIELAMKLGVLTYAEGLTLGVQFSIEYTAGWLRKWSSVDEKTTIQKQSEAVAALVRKLAPALELTFKAELSALPVTYCTSFPSLVSPIRGILDPDSALALLTGLVALRRLLVHKKGVCSHAFGDRNLLVGFAAMIVPVAQCASGAIGKGKPIFEAMAEYAQIVGSDSPHERLWHELSDFEWGPLLASADADAEVIVDWLLARLVELEPTSSELPLCAEALKNAIDAGRAVGRPISETQVDMVRGGIGGKWSEGLRGQTQLALVEVLSAVDRERALEMSLDMLERTAKSLNDAGEDVPARSRQSELMRWAFVGLVERGLVGRVPEYGSAALLRALSDEVDAICSSDPAADGPERRSADLPFVFVCYVLRYVGCESLEARKWILRQVQNQPECPLRALGLFLEPTKWGDAYSDLVATLMTRTSKDGLLEMMRLISNAVHDGRYLEAVLGGEFAWVVQLAVQQLDNESELISNGAAWSMMEIARQLEAEHLELSAAKAVMQGLRYSARHPRLSVRLAVAFGLAKLSQFARCEVMREIAVDLVGVEDGLGAGGLVNDSSGIVRGIVRFGRAAGLANRGIEQAKVPSC